MSGGVNPLGGLGVIEQAIQRAARATGIDFGFLMRTARRESGYNAGAKAGSSTAAGLFQFVEQTWMATLKRHGAAHGYARYAALISEGGDGKFSIPQGSEARKAVMDLRFDPHAAAVMAGELAADHAAYLRGRVGREPTGGELYAAHFLGPQGSARLIQAFKSSPNTPAANLFPDAAGANHNVFYRNGRPLTVAEVYTDLSQTGGGVTAVKAAADPGQPAFVAYAGAARTERLREQALLVNFFLSDGDAGQPDIRRLYSSEMLAAYARARNVKDR
jgi:hypothetical protein